MAIYHLSVKIVGRSSGRSAVAAAAYRSGECITNEWDGVTHDFRKKNWIVFQEIMLPDQAPKEYRNRKILWNTVETAEKSKTAQLAREFELALPKELPHERQVDLVEAFVKNELVSQGMCVDIAIHNPPQTNDRHQPVDSAGNVTHDIEAMQFLNPHAHILCTMRPIAENGKWEAKSQAEYICRRGEEECALTAAEYAEKKASGWKKLYQYQTKEKKKVWLTAEEGTERELKRLSKQPKTTPYGRKNPKIEYWNSEERVPEWRNAWERLVNQSLEKIDSEERVDARSYKEQNLDKLPTMHLGVASVNMEKRADRLEQEGVSDEAIKRSDIGNLNREVKKYNQLAEYIEKEILALKTIAENVKTRIFSAFEQMKDRMKKNEASQITFQKQKNEINQELIEVSGRIQYYEMESDRIQKKIAMAKQRKQLLTAQIQQVNHLLHPKRTADLKAEIRKAEQEEDTLKAYLARIQKDSGFEARESLALAKEQETNLESNLEKIIDNLNCLKIDQAHSRMEYQENYSILPENMKEMIYSVENEKHGKEDLKTDVKSKYYSTR